MAEERREAKVHAYVGLVVADALFILVVCAAALYRQRPSWVAYAVSVPLVAGIFLLQRHPFTFHWRDHRLVVSLDEAAVLVALLAVPAPLFVFAVLAAGTVAQLWGGPRDRIKRAFNVGQYVLAASVSAGIFVFLTGRGLPAVGAAALSAVAFGTMANLLLAGVFAFLSGSSIFSVFRERFLIQGLNSAAIGVAGGLSLVALWNLHPLATLALVPFVYIVMQYWRLHASADRELDVHRRLANATHDLVGTANLHAVAERVLTECEALLDCGRAELRVLDETLGREFGSGPRRTAPVVAPLPRGLGELRVWARQGKEEFGEQELALVRTIAGQAASALENARALSRLDTYLSTAQDAVLLVEKDGVVSYLNPAARRLFAVPDGAPAPRAADFFDDPSLRELPLVPLLVEAKARSLGSSREFLIEAHAGPVLESDRVTGAVIVVRDVTERKRLEDEAKRQSEALAQSEKLSALGTLVAGVAHEINNPLTYMAGNLQLLQLDVTERLARSDLPAEERAFLDTVAEEIRVALDGSERITHIASSLKNVARRGQASETRREEDVNRIVRDVAAVVRAGINSKLRFELALAPELPHVNARGSEMHQVVLNLVKNAAEALATHPDGWVCVRTFALGSDVILEVEDNGPGIPAELQRNLFSPFFTTKENGTGLGLSISHRIIAAHGGEMTVASVEGTGTCFRVRLPALLTSAEGAVIPATRVLP